MAGRRKTRKQRGGRRIGKGATGTVYTPVLACDDGSDAPYRGSGFIGKAIPETSLARETKHAAALKGLGPRVIAPVHRCMLAEEQTNSNFISNRNRENIYPPNNRHAGRRRYLDYQVIYPYGGQTVTELLATRANHPIIINAIKEFIPDLYEFNKHYQHFDLHFENMVFDGEQIRMIDFENMRPATPETANVDICKILLSLFHFLHRYTQDNPSDTTYKAWLAENTLFSDFGRCIDRPYEEIVAAINSIPTPVKRSKCSSKGCTIMG